MKKQATIEISRAGWVGDYVDPMTFMLCGRRTVRIMMRIGTTKNMINLLKEAKSTMDPKDRMDTLHKAEKVLIDEMPDHSNLLLYKTIYG